VPRVEVERAQRFAPVGLVHVDGHRRPQTRAQVVDGAAERLEVGEGVPLGEFGRADGVEQFTDRFS
jgi:hypothetical protein